jgi:hypothetical protein
MRVVAEKVSEVVERSFVTFRLYGNGTENETTQDRPEMGMAGFLKKNDESSLHFEGLCSDHKDNFY